MWSYLQKSNRISGTRLVSPIAPEVIKQAETVLFSVFARYGDSIIAFKTINEFLIEHPDKKYILFTTHQAAPYAEALIAGPLTSIAVNKRRDPIRMWRLARELAKNPPDLGLNPWSHGDESEYFISFCRRYAPYRDFAKFERNHNLYRRTREYLGLTSPPAGARPRTVGQVLHVVICPFSTDVRKSLDAARIEQLLEAVRVRYPGATIAMAGMRGELERVRNTAIQRFVLEKARRASERFIDLLRNADLFIGVDAGPLHLADALDVPAIGIFGPTAPETILDAGSKILPLRHEKLDGVFCDVRRCTDPLCLRALLAPLSLDNAVSVQPDRQLHLEGEICAMDANRWNIAAPSSDR